MSECDVLTVDLFPENISFSKFTPEDYLTQTAKDMLHLLKVPDSFSSTLDLACGSPILNLFKKLHTLFGVQLLLQRHPMYQFQG